MSLENRIQRLENALGQDATRDFEEIRFDIGRIGGPSRTWCRMFLKGGRYAGQVNYDKEGETSAIHGEVPLCYQSKNAPEGQEEAGDGPAGCIRRFEKT